MESSPHFSKEELCCKHCGECHMDPIFMERLEAMRVSSGIVMPIVSGYRCSTYNIQVSNTGMAGPHTTGCAVDVRIKGGDAITLIRHALYHGITGIGVSQKGDHDKRFLHLDRLDYKEGRPRPWIWSY